MLHRVDCHNNIDIAPAGGGDRSVNINSTDQDIKGVVCEGSIFRCLIHRLSGPCLIFIQGRHPFPPVRVCLIFLLVDDLCLFGIVRDRVLQKRQIGFVTDRRVDISIEQSLSQSKGRIKDPLLYLSISVQLLNIVDHLIDQFRIRSFKNAK